MDKDKFEGFKRQRLEENERLYGTEIREKYGEEAVRAANAHFLKLDAAALERARELEREMFRLLGEAMDAGDPAGENARRACDLHRQWLLLYVPEGQYSPGYHRSLGELYDSDERFRAYYDREREGLAAFLRRTLDIHCR